MNSINQPENQSGNCLHSLSKQVNTMNETILLVEDEPSIADNIIYALDTEGFKVRWHSSGKEALAVLEAEDVDLTILDIGLPDINGFDLAKEIRKRFELPIIFLTARDSEVDRVVGLEIGGDDYVVKPFSPRELTARVRAVLRRSGRTSRAPGPASEPAGESPFVTDESKYCILFRGEKLDLSRYEYRLLKVLVKTPGRVFSREKLMELAWDEPDMSLERTVDTHIKTIRQKLRSVDPDHDWIVTHRGIGYSLKDSS
jgi:two-component system catabolic regulation response regulator CreB